MAYRVPLMRPSLPDKEEFKKIVDELWESRMLSNFSKYSKLMESSAKEYFGSDRHFASVVSCDIGLTLLLKCFNFPKGSEVLVPSFTFNSTVNSIMWNDLVPVFVDIEPVGYTISLEDIKKKLTDKTVAIMGVHIFGNPCQMVSLEYMAKKQGLKLIFDAAHAYGSKFGGNHICEFGDAGVYSFSGTKLITSAEGGLVYIKDKEIADKFAQARNYGFVGDYNTKILGLNGKISEFHSAIAYLAMKDADKIVSRRQEIANRYLKGIKKSGFQEVGEHNLSSYKDFSIEVENRDAVYKILEEKGIQTKKYFFPNHYSDFYSAKLDFSSVRLPNTESLYEKILCIPIFNDITEDQINYVIDTLNAVL